MAVELKHHCGSQTILTEKCFQKRSIRLIVPSGQNTTGKCV